MNLGRTDCNLVLITLSFSSSFLKSYKYSGINDTDCFLQLNNTGCIQWSFFRIFEIIIFCFVVAICDLVHAVEAMYGRP